MRSICRFMNILFYHLNQSTSDQTLTHLSLYTLGYLEIWKITCGIFLSTCRAYGLSITFIAYLNVLYIISK